MVNYENSKIYKIINLDTNNIYYGSTTGTLNRRFREHKSRAKNNKNKEYSKLCFTTDNVKIELVKNIDCKNKKELHDIESSYIINNECVNKYIPNRTLKQYYLDNKETIDKKSKLWAKNNKEKKLEYMKGYHQKNKQKIAEYQSKIIICECGHKISQGKIARHKKTKKHEMAMRSVGK